MIAKMYANRLFEFFLYRVIGSLLSAHLIIVDPDQPFGSIAPAGYSNELLLLAHDLAGRLLPAFDNTTTGLPYPRVSNKEAELLLLKMMLAVDLMSSVFC